MTKSNRGLASLNLSHLMAALDEAAIVAVTDKHGLITYANKKFCEISRYPEEELLGKNHRIINSGFHPKEFFEEMWKTITQGKTWEGEICNRAKDGSIYWVHTTIVPFLDVNGKPETYVSVRYDVTQRKSAFEELKQTKAQVLQQDRLASLGLMASSLAHEIGTPLGIIRSRAELAAKRSADNPSVLDSLNVVVTQIDRITKLVHSLLHIARGRKSDFVTSIDLDMVIQDVLNLLEHEFGRKQIELKKDIQPGCRLKAESGPLGQVLINLLINAIHAVEEARKQGRMSSHQVTLGVLDTGSEIRIAISDTGIGISEENQRELFRPFFTTKPIGHGTGLGLATSFSLVKSWGGQIQVESQLGIGTTFTVIIPHTESSINLN